MKLGGCLFRNFSTSYFTNHRLFFSTTPLSPAPSPRKPVTVYLTERLAFSEEDSLSISKKLLRLRDTSPSNHAHVTDLISYEKSDTVIKYLQQHCGLNLSHIKKTVTKHPTILGSNVDKTLKPKIKLLQDLGFSTSDLAHVLSRNPRLYLLYDLGPAIQALRGILGSDGYVVKALKGLKRDTAPTITKNLIPNVTMLENEYGVPRDKIRKFLVKEPGVFIRPTKWLRGVVVRVEDKWGISRDSVEFFRAVQAFYGITDEKIELKCEVYRSFGWSECEIMSLIRRLPVSVVYSEARIKKLLGFYINELGYQPAYMASRAPLFSYSLENRVLPRHRVLSILKEKGLVKADYQLISSLVVPEDRFFRTWVLPYENKVPEVCEVYSFREATSEEDLHMEASEGGSESPSAA